VAQVRAALDFDRIDYVELVDAETLQPVTDVERPAVLAVAAFIGRTRLIDNVRVARAAG
jgi:pantoate--beta-alanine ligase